MDDALWTLFTVPVREPDGRLASPEGELPVVAAALTTVGTASAQRKIPLPDGNGILHH
ncbi:hypothetical protein ABT040_07360 [Streptomyces sp. NPDC002688]|uniref:hypothetical protein n=1 Tax=Streptomyces sp. NPDC002688 TaxID=3154423 RepID=UPI00331E2844